MKSRPAKSGSTSSPHVVAPLTPLGGGFFWANSANHGADITANVWAKCSHCQRSNYRELVRALPLNETEVAVTAYRIYAVDTDGCQILNSELTEANDLEALRTAFEAVRRFPAQRVRLLECDPDNAPDSERSSLH